ncbi:MAG: VacJ family lipoprotein [Gammaproteobacteria bacterium]|nr:VacJ family lipoprotein [Gammaproteobacteria bacterium]
MTQTNKTTIIFSHHGRRLLCALLLSSTVGCATLSGPAQENDPWESYNRSMYHFNDGLDRSLIKPIAKSYQFILPSFVQTGVSNFFGNLDDFIVIINDILQLKGRQGLQDGVRVLTNSSLGLLGLIDVASALGLEKHNEDFGQTLGLWGVPSGPYFVLPLFGPSSVRDSVGIYADSLINPLYTNIATEYGNATMWGAVSLNLVNIRARLLKTSSILDTASLDSYAYSREAYLHRRQNLVHDGVIPSSENLADELDQLDELDALDELDETPNT